MPKIESNRLFNSPVMLAQTLQNGNIAVVTKHDGICIYNPETSETVAQLKIDELESDNSTFAFSHDGGYFAFSHNTSKGYALRLIDINTKSLVRSYATKDNPIERLAFGPSSTYIVAGTSTGRVFLWRVDSVNLIARLSSFPEYTPHLLTAPIQNYVSAIAFSVPARTLIG